MAIATTPTPKAAAKPAHPLRKRCPKVIKVPGGAPPRPPLAKVGKATGGKQKAAKKNNFKVAVSVPSNFKIVVRKRKTGSSKGIDDPSENKTTRPYINK